MKVDLAKLDRAFNPKCVVVVGDSKRSDFEWLRSQSTFKGKLYSVQVSPETIRDITALGIENHTSLLDVPEPVDLAIIAVPRTAVPGVIEDCIRKEVAVAHVFSSGFSEIDTEEGIRLERKLAERAKQANLHLIGPNCMGIFNPRLGLRQSAEQYTGSWGSVGFISQSGSHALTFSLEAHLQGIDMGKSVSFGNGIVLDSADFLEYLGQDPEIKVIGMYLEGVKDGRRFFRMLREVAAKKPVVVWKGGRTEAGERAIASHTGALAVSQAVWEAAVRQCGAIKVDRMEELIDTVKALLYLAPVYGGRVAVAGSSGGGSVAIADVFVETGLKVPSLTRESYDELATFFNVIGGSYRNPIDTAGNPVRREMKRIMGILERDANIDNLVLMVSNKPGRSTNHQTLQSDLNFMNDLRKRASKPVMVIVFFSTPDGVREARDIMLQFQEIDIPAFPSIERGAFALKNALDYYNLKGGS